MLSNFSPHFVDLNPTAAMICIKYIQSLSIKHVMKMSDVSDQVVQKMCQLLNKKEFIQTYFLSLEEEYLKEGKEFFLLDNIIDAVHPTLTKVISTLLTENNNQLVTLLWTREKINIHGREPTKIQWTTFPEEIQAVQMKPLKEVDTRICELFSYYNELYRDLRKQELILAKIKTKCETDSEQSIPISLVRKIYLTCIMEMLETHILEESVVSKMFEFLNDETFLLECIRASKNRSEEEDTEFDLMNSLKTIVEAIYKVSIDRLQSENPADNLLP